MANRKGPDEITSEWLDVTPELAFKLLEANTHNRPLVQSRVERYARDMRAGQWRVNGDAVRFDINGILIDGQHRLWAVTESGVTLKMLVVRGLEPEAQDTIDQGKPRSIKEVFHLGGIENSRLVAPILLTIFRVSTNKPHIYTPEVAKAMYDYWHDDVQWMASAVSRYTKRATVAAALTIAHRKTPSVTDLFTGMVNSGTNLVQGQPAWLLREYIIAMLTRKRQSDVESMVVKKTLRALLAHLQKEKMANLQQSDAGWAYFVPDRRVLIPAAMRDSVWPVTEEK